MIRLTLILLTGLFVAMLVFGTDGGSTDPDEIAETVLEAQESVNEIATEPSAGVTIAEAIEPEVGIVEAPETEIEVAQAAPLDLTTTAIAEALAETSIVETVALEEPTLDDVAEPDVSIEPEPVIEPAKMYEVTGNSVNLRAGPSTSFSIAGNLRRGARAELVEEVDNGWFKIRSIETGQVGFMASRFLNLIER